MNNDTYIFIAVDFYRQKILLVADTEAQLSRDILSWYGTDSQAELGMWKYRVERQTYEHIVGEMKNKGVAFYEVAQPK